MLGIRMINELKVYVASDRVERGVSMIIDKATLDTCSISCHTCT